MKYSMPPERSGGSSRSAGERGDRARQPYCSSSNRRRRRPADADKWFHCVHCSQPVVPDAFGTAHRNHCPWCLWSRHVDDEEPGDRAAECRGAMEPIAVWARPGGDWAIIHRCRTCGELRSNRIAGDDNELALVSLAARALSQPPFPLCRLSAIGGGGIEEEEDEACDTAEDPC